MKILLVLAVIALAAPCVNAANLAQTINIGETRQSVRIAAGADCGAAPQLKEIYSLADGNAAVAHYDGDVLVRGFIIKGGY